MYTIYKITNVITGDFYIGFTSLGNPNRRFTKHKATAKAGRGFYFHNAIRKYGSENFVFEIIEQGIDTKEGLVLRESFWIKTLTPKYNMTIGGEGRQGLPAWNKGIPMSEEEKRKMKGRLPWSVGKHFTDEHKVKLSSANRSQVPWNKGRICSSLTEEHKQKLSESNKGKHFKKKDAQVVAECEFRGK